MAGRWGVGARRGWTRARARAGVAGLQLEWAMEASWVLLPYMSALCLRHMPAIYVCLIWWDMEALWVLLPYMSALYVPYMSVL